MSSSSARNRAQIDDVPKLSLWQNLTEVHINPLNGKCTTLPLLSLRSHYSRNFHLSWLGFWVAFLSWFAFSPLVPEAVKLDLKLTPAQVGNSNTVSLCSALLVRIIVGPLVDRYGPRKVMAGLLVIGAIPSGLAGTINSAEGLYTIRFFIGILGATFVPCQAWITAFFDKRTVGRANAIAGGWGNSGGGFTFIIMVALYNKLKSDGLSTHSAWRAAFAIVPVPALLVTAAAILVFGTDHPNGRWEDRRLLSTVSTVSEHDQEKSAITQVTEASRNKEPVLSMHPDSAKGSQVDVFVEPIPQLDTITALDTAVNQEITSQAAATVLMSSITWLPSLAYMTTFGFELAIDANLSNVLFGLFHSPSFGQTKSGYIASIYGLLNVFTRPAGGYFGDLIYLRFGVTGKKYLTLVCGALMGLLSIALGLYIDKHDNPSLAVVIFVFALTAVIDEAGNGANFALVPHCHPNYNGFITGIVGAMGNMGGVFYALIFRFQPGPFGKAF